MENRSFSARIRFLLWISVHNHSIHLGILTGGTNYKSVSALSLNQFIHHFDGLSDFSSPWESVIRNQETLRIENLIRMLELKDFDSFQATIGKENFKKLFKLYKCSGMQPLLGNINKTK